MEVGHLVSLAESARSDYYRRLSGSTSQHWWTSVVVTASSPLQAERYEDEIHRRLKQGTIPLGVRYLVVPDPDGRRIGSGGATINAVRALLKDQDTSDSLAAWWSRERVLLVHSGGDSRRLPQYSLTGKLFSALPVLSPTGDVSTVFDETLALSTAWVSGFASGLLVAAGDVILTFDASKVNWNRPGITGVGMRQDARVGGSHGVYVSDVSGRVYSFLQKAAAREIEEAGGMLEDGKVAVDTGLLRFSPDVAALLGELAGIEVQTGGWHLAASELLSPQLDRPLDLYEQVTMALTGQWKPSAEDPTAFHRLFHALQGTPFWCSVVEGEFTHVGTTSLFRRLMSGELSAVYAAQRRLGTALPRGLRSSGMILDSVLSEGGEIGPGSTVIECDLNVPVRAARGSVLHGLTGLEEPVEVPEDVVVHHLPVLADGVMGAVIRVYGVDDDPKHLVSGIQSTWLGRPILDAIAALGLQPEEVWPGIDPTSRSLWNASLFPLAPLPEAWKYARWMMGLSSTVDARSWRATSRFSLDSSTRHANTAAMSNYRAKRADASWRNTVLDLADSDADLRALLAHSPNLTALADVGRALTRRAASIESYPQAASRQFQASLFFAQAGLDRESAESRALAFESVRRAVTLGASMAPSAADGLGPWRCDSVRVSAPARLDFGGGWSDTPPFCLDWGGTVLNAAVLLNEQYPISIEVRRLQEPVVRINIPGTPGANLVISDTEMLRHDLTPGSPFALAKIALDMAGICPPGSSLGSSLAELGGGVAITLSVDLPVGSGLGTSSIVSAALLRAVWEMRGVSLSPEELSETVMRLEQTLTTGGGWQDQAGGIFPGMKIITTGPGLRQRLRVRPLAWTPDRQQEFLDHLVVYYTGINRIAKNLLAQVVGSYLAREAATVQVLHSIKTLATEMGHAMEEGEWKHLGWLLDRHWQLNQVLDPNTSNALIHALLEELRPSLAGAKLAGAGGGGFLILLAPDPDAASALRSRLTARQDGGALYSCRIAGEGLQVERA